MYRRMAEGELRDALGDTPVVLLHGARQTGKSTLAQTVGRSIGATYISLDDPVPRETAGRDPRSLLDSQSAPLIIDEVQRAPQLFLALKASVDRDRRPGRFLLTGSANVLSLPKIADSLAGRLAIVDLNPLSQSEVEGADSRFVDRLFSGEPPVQFSPDDDLPARIVKGGYPEPLARPKPNRRDAWFSDYVRSLLERDVRDLANIEGLGQMPKLLKLLAVRSGAALNVADLSAEIRIPNTSLHRYLDLLQALFLTFQLPAWSTDQSAKLTKTPKTYLVDSGLNCYLQNADESELTRDGDLFQSSMRGFVAAELRRLSAFSSTRPVMHHLRTVKRLEVDFVLETRRGEIAGVTCTRSRHLLPEHFDGLRYLRELAGERFVRGVVLYCGTEIQQFDPVNIAMPVSALWKT